MKRTLTLRSETLSDLTVVEMSAVVGGHEPPTSPLKECLNDPFYTLQATRCFCP